MVTYVDRAARIKELDRIRLAKQKKDAKWRPTLDPNTKYVYFNGEWVDIKTRRPLSPLAPMPNQWQQASPDDLMKYWPDIQYDPNDLRLDYAGPTYPGFKNVFRNDDVAWRNYVAHTLTTALFAEKSLNPGSYAFEVLDYDNLVKPELPENVPYSVKLVNGLPINRPLTVEDMIIYIPNHLKERFRGEFMTASLQGSTMSLRQWCYKNRDKF